MAHKAEKILPKVLNHRAANLSSPKKSDLVPKKPGRSFKTYTYDKTRKPNTK